jgi:predicted DNA-binding transcriptional regulator
MTVYRPHCATVSSELADEVVTLHLKTKRYYTLNSTAACVWRVLDGGATEDAMAAALTREFDISEEDARAHVAALVRTLLESELIEPCGSGMPSRR